MTEKYVPIPPPQQQQEEGRQLPPAYAPHVFIQKEEEENSRKVRWFSSAILVLLFSVSIILILKRIGMIETVSSDCTNMKLVREKEIIVAERLKDKSATLSKEMTDIVNGRFDLAQKELKDACEMTTSFDRCPDNNNNMVVPMEIIQERILESDLPSTAGKLNEHRRNNCNITCNTTSIKYNSIPKVEYLRYLAKNLKEYHKLSLVYVVVCVWFLYVFKQDYRIYILLSLLAITGYLQNHNPVDEIGIAMIKVCSKPGWMEIHLLKL